MNDGTTYEAESRSADYVAYEAESKKRGWGTLQEAPSMWEAYVCYRALLRNRLVSMPFGDPASPNPGSFLAQVDELEATPIAEVEPFPKELSDGSSPS
jgi:hypothetical protein